MNLSTLIVCDDADGKLAELEIIVLECADLNMAGSTSRELAAEKVAEMHPKLVWIELSSDPEAGLNLLSELKQQFPDIHYLVSNHALEGTLVKSAMNKGAIDFLDAKSVREQLPDVIGRIAAKEIAHKQAIDKLDAQREQMKQMREKKMTSDHIKSSATVSHMRETSNQMESRGAMNMVLFIIMIALAIGGVVFYVMQPK